MSRTPTTLINAFTAKAKQQPMPVFQGEQRQRVLTLISDAIYGGRQVDVMRAVEKDPSLMFEDVVKHPRVPEPFTRACLRGGMPAGYLLALTSGFDVNTECKQRRGWSDLLYVAVSEGRLADVTLLLAMGASPNPLPATEATRSDPVSSGPSLMACAITSWASELRDNSRCLPVVAMSLLDAGLVIQKSDPYAYFHQVISAVDFEAEGMMPAASKLMAMLVKAGADIDGMPGSEVQNALSHAIGSSDGPAVEVLVLLGADVTSKKPGEADIYERMRKNKLDAYIPKVQAHAMSRVINQIRSDTANPPGNSEVDTHEHPQAKRRAASRL